MSPGGACCLSRFLVFKKKALSVGGFFRRCVLPKRTNNGTSVRREGEITALSGLPWRAQPCNLAAVHPPFQAFASDQTNLKLAC